MRALFGTLLVSTVVRTTAFVPSTKGPVRGVMVTFSSERHAASRSNQDEPPSSVSTAELEDDIRQLRQQATSKLDALMEQMNELQDLNQEHTVHDVTISKSATNNKTESKIVAASDVRNVEVKELPSSSTVPIDKCHTTKSPSDQSPTAVPTKKATTTTTALPSSIATPVDLLEGTVWNIAFNIGREHGTWMPATWGASGDRLLLACTVEFTADRIEPTNVDDDNDDEFFQQPGPYPRQPALKLKVTNAMVRSHGVGPTSVGQRPLAVGATGVYQVSRGQGPSGTDIVRFGIDLDEAVTLGAALGSLHSDVTCPAGRLYGTCGYFGADTALSTQSSTRMDRDAAQDRYDRAVAHVEGLQRVHAHSAPDDPLLRTMWQSWETVRKLPSTLVARKDVNEAAQELRRARQRHPDRSRLRFDRDQRVALSKEGGVCCKVHQTATATLEYHILGRLQVACIGRGESMASVDSKKKKVTSQPDDTTAEDSART